VRPRNIRLGISRNNQKHATLLQNLLFQSLLKAQHVSSGTPLIIRSCILYLQRLVYKHVWLPAVVKAEWEIQYTAPDDERCAARNMLNLQ
jgi:hypothetical protein